MKKYSMFLPAGMLLLSAALLLGDAGWIPHNCQLFLQAIAVGLELVGSFRQCRMKREEEP